MLNLVRAARTAFQSPDFDAQALAAELHGSIRGEVRFDDGSRALYATDASNYRQVPLGVVVPRGKDDVMAAVEVCRRHGAPILSRGGGTSLAGQTCNVAVVLDFSKYMDRILEIDPVRRRARVEPGVVLDDLRDAAEEHRLTFGPDPATHNRCALGGMIGNNSCGVHSVMAGMTDANVEELEILTYDGLLMRVRATSDGELEEIIAAGGRRGEIYAKLRALRDRCAPLIRERYPGIPRRVSGYNLNQLLPENGFDVARALVGSEGTCVTVLEATVRLVQSPPERVLLVLGYDDISTACDDVPEILPHRPIGLEGFDGKLVEDMRKKGLQSRDIALLPEGGGWLLVELGADRWEEAEVRARALMVKLEKRRDAPIMKLFTDRGQQRRIWEVRESATGAISVVPGQAPTWPGWEDAAVPPERLGGYLRGFRELVTRYGYNTALYGHFGEGCVHARINFDFGTADGIQRFRSFVGEAAELVVRYGGSLSGEHGDGQARAELLPMMFGEELVRAFGEFKAIWDPDGKMNPGKMVDPYRIDQNLRVAEFHPARPKTHFGFVEDDGSLVNAALRCVGVGKCRRHDAGTMCPSYMVTREEMHSTRGRARLLFEMVQGMDGVGEGRQLQVGTSGGSQRATPWTLRGFPGLRPTRGSRSQPLHRGWRDKHVKEALDLCLACKGCKSECPVQVDMATYKAEFLSHYYAGRVRPVSAYTMGQIYRWARLAARMPAVANFFTQTPLVRDIVKRVGGVAPERALPAFAPQTFTQWFRQRGPRNEGKPQVILWPDTFNNHFHPDTARAGVEVLEAAGYQVLIPERSLCCGRPLYDYGLLDRAKRQLRQILDALYPQILACIPLIGLEPSCIAVFRDELVNLFPNDPAARRLSEQSFVLSEFLQKIEGYDPPKLRGTALVHGHCHHKAIMKMDDEEAVLRKLSLDFKVLDAGCCGMAGAFGFEKEHYDVSIACGERVLLPSVRAASEETLIIADGFSCREQITQTTGRKALHLAEVLQMAMREDGRSAGDETGLLLAGVDWRLTRRKSE